MTLAHAGPARRTTSVAVPLTPSDKGTLLIAATMGTKTRADFLVDTGATYTVVNQRVLSELRREGAVVAVRDVRAAIADGRDSTATIYRASRLSLSPTCTLENVEVAHLGGNQRNMLGLSALRQLSPFVLDVERRQMLLTCPD